MSTKDPEPDTGPAEPDPRSDADASVAGEEDPTASGSSRREPPRPGDVPLANLPPPDAPGGADSGAEEKTDPEAKTAPDPEADPLADEASGPGSESEPEQEPKTEAEIADDEGFTDIASAIRALLGEDAAEGAGFGVESDSDVDADADADVDADADAGREPRTPGAPAEVPPAARGTSGSETLPATGRPAVAEPIGAAGEQVDDGAGGVDLLAPVPGEADEESARDRAAPAPTAAASEVTEAGLPDAAPRVARSRSRRHPRLLVAALVVAALSAAMAFAKAQQVGDLVTQRDDRRAIERVAAAFGSAYLSYDFEHADDSGRAVQALATLEFARAYATTSAPGIQELFSSRQTTTQARTKEVFVGGVHPRRARALVVVDVTASSPTEGKQRLDDVSFVLDLARTTGGWRVARVARAPQPALAAGTATPPSSSP